MPAVPVSQDKIRFYDRYKAVNEVFQGARHPIDVHGSAENDHVSFLHFRQQHLHVIILNTLARRFRPAGPVTQAWFHAKPARVKQFYLTALFSHSLQEGRHQEGRVPFLHERTCIKG
jgi:hypothetical protein